MSETKRIIEIGRKETQGSQKLQYLVLEPRSRTKGEMAGTFQEVKRTIRWEPSRTAIIWKDHTCKGAAERVAEIATATNRMLSVARTTDVFIIHAPSETMSFYESTAERQHTINTLFIESPVEIKWNESDPIREEKPLAFIQSLAVVVMHRARDGHSISKGFGIGREETRLGQIRSRLSNYVRGCD